MAVARVRYSTPPARQSYGTRTPGFQTLSGPRRLTSPLTVANLLNSGQGYTKPQTGSADDPYAGLSSQLGRSTPGAGNGLGGSFATIDQLPATTAPAPASATPASSTTPAFGDPNDQWHKPGGGAATSPGTVNFSDDPILAQIRALNQQQVANAEDSALASKKQELIRFGDSGLAQSLLGDQNTASAAGQNPFSTVAQLLQAHGRADTQIDQRDNLANLFYSSTRANHLGDENTNYLQNTANAQANLRSLLSGYDANVASAKQSALDRELQGESDAYNRAVQFALQYGTGSGGGGGTATDPNAPTADPRSPYGGLIPVQGYGGASPYYAARGIRNLFAS